MNERHQDSDNCDAMQSQSQSRQSGEWDMWSDCFWELHTSELIPSYQTVRYTLLPKKGG